MHVLGATDAVVETLDPCVKAGGTPIEQETAQGPRPACAFPNGQTCLLFDLESWLCTGEEEKPSRKGLLFGVLAVGALAWIVTRMPLRRRAYA